MDWPSMQGVSIPVAQHAGLGLLETQKRLPGDSWVYSAGFFIENALCGAAVI